MTNKSIKQITKASDLEGLSMLDDVEVKYNTHGFVGKLEGIYGKTFQMNKIKYFVVSQVKPSSESTSKNLLTSLLFYLQSEDEITLKGNGVITRYYDLDVGTSKEDTPNLQSAIEKCVTIFINNLSHKFINY